MKKIYQYLIIALFILTIFFAKSNISAFAEESFTIKSKSAFQIEYNTGTVIYQKNQLQRLPIASMCKIMTQLLCYEAIDNQKISLDEMVTVSKNASSMGGSQVFLESDAQYSVDDLLKSISIASANDACVAIAEHICGNTKDFVKLMNDRANELGMDNTLFANCTGLPAPEQYSCARDVAVMFKELLKHDEYFKYTTIWMDEIQHPNNRITQITNTNKLIKFYNGCDSGKTGYTAEAGHCLCASAKRDNMRLITVVIGAPDSKRRFFEVSALFDTAFANFCNKTILKAGQPLDESINVKKGKKESLSIEIANDFNYFCNKNEKYTVETVFEKDKQVKAPICQGDCVGNVTIYIDGVSIGKVDVVASETILSKTYYDSIKDITNKWKLN